jgi:hypothetical protein
MRNCLHKAAKKTRSLIQASSPVLSSFRELTICNDRLEDISIRNHNDYSLSYYHRLVGDTKLSEFKRIKWLRIMKEDGYTGIDIDENDGKYSVWRYE